MLGILALNKPIYEYKNKKKQLTFKIEILNCLKAAETFGNRIERFQEIHHQQFTAFPQNCNKMIE